MKLTKQVIGRINQPHCIAELMKTLGFSEQWIKRLLSQNKPNGPLTTYGALKVIRKETGLADAQILEMPKTKRVARASAL